jgi:glycerate dehydrogenase
MKDLQMAYESWRSVNLGGTKRVVVTWELPGSRWLDVLTDADCAVEVNLKGELTHADIAAAVGKHCDGVTGYVTESWGEELFSALKWAGGRAYSNYAAGFNNVDLKAATRNGTAVGNTPGVISETVAEYDLNRNERLEEYKAVQCLHSVRKAPTYHLPKIVHS